MMSISCLNMARSASHPGPLTTPKIFARNRLAKSTPILDRESEILAGRDLIAPETAECHEGCSPCNLCWGLHLRCTMSGLRDGPAITDGQTPWPRATKIFIRISLSMNIAVLIAVCTVLIASSSAEHANYVWGPPTVGRGILLSVYFSILAGSVVLLTLHVRNPGVAAIEHMVAALLCTQIMYKISTPATAGPANPVAISNLCISALHGVTVYLLWRKFESRPPSRRNTTLIFWGAKDRALLPQLIASFG
jgi:hypothetical protein